MLFKEGSMDKFSKNGIIVGIISSLLFLYLVDPILRSISSLVIALSSSILSSYLDDLYTKCALGVTQDPALIIYGLFYALPFGLSMGIFFSYISRSFKKQKKLDSNNDTTLHKRVVRLLLTSALVFFLLSLISAVSYWSIWFQQKTITSFTQHIRIISPYIDNATEKALWSEWSLMNSADDYSKIIQKIEKIAKANSITLPENPAFNLTSLY